MCLDAGKSAAIIRAALAARMITQADLCERLELSKNLFNKFLRRKINLLDEDIERILKELDLGDLI